MEENYFKLEAIKDQKAMEIVYLLDIFEGKVSLGEILNTEIPLLNHLKKAKIKLNDDIRNNRK
jgi:hypothetical protein